LGGGWRRVTIAGRALVTPEACGASATRTRPGPWGTLLVGQADGRVPICGAQRPAKLRLAVTLVDMTMMLERAWSAGILTLVRRSRQQRGKGARVGGGARAVASTCDAMLGFHRLHWKHDAVVVFRSYRLMLAATVKVVGRRRAPGEILHWFLRCQQRHSFLASLPC
jgi:hypothetical protein